MVLQESVMPIGQNGCNQLLILIQFIFVLKVIQFVSYQDVLHQFATINIQEQDIHVIKTFKYVHQKEKLNQC